MQQLNALNLDTFGYTQTDTHGAPMRIELAKTVDADNLGVHTTIGALKSDARPVLWVTCTFPTPGAEHNESSWSIGLAFPSRDALLLATANEAFMAAALRHLATTIPKLQGTPLLGVIPDFPSQVHINATDHPDTTGTTDRAWLSRVIMSAFGARQV
ncbi:MAG: hypothetical protein AWU57_459 [Marinobacter sp. T13-3]|nr:MAG: hypothetical protein AWU57_459 [Marinobacter sp. T13-3]